jgi:hypothetical protein
LAALILVHIILVTGALAYSLVEIKVFFLVNLLFLLSLLHLCELLLLDLLKPRLLFSFGSLVVLMERLKVVLDNLVPLFLSWDQLCAWVNVEHYLLFFDHATSRGSHTLSLGSA